MADLCSLVANQPQGVNRSCLPYMKAVKAVLILDPEETFTATSVYAKATWKAKVDTDLDCYVAQIYGYTPEGGEVVTGTTAFGQTYPIRETPSGGIFHLQSSPCDYRNLMAAVNGNQYGIAFVLEDGSIMLWVDETSTFRPFRAIAIVPAATLPGADNLHEYYKLQIYFQDTTEFRQFAVVKPSWSVLNSLWLYMPNGLYLSLTTYDHTAPVVTVNERCQDIFAGLVAGDWGIVEQSGSRTISTAVEAASTGVYTITLSAALAAVGDFVTLRVKNSATDNGVGPFTDVSDLLRIEYTV